MSGEEALVAFLRARLDEDGEVARRSADFGGGINGYRWRVSGSHTDDGGTYWRVAASAVAGDHEQVIEVVGSGMSGGGAHTEQVAHHIARHDPARVLREVEAKRRIVDRYAWLREHGDTGDAAWILPLLAATYSDHPDYRPDWSPSA